MRGEHLTAAELSTADRPRFDALAVAHGDVFCRTAWHPGEPDKLRLVGLYTSTGELSGGFQLAVTRRFGLRCFENPAFTPSVGPFFASQGSNRVAGQTFQKAVLEAIAAYLDAQGPALVSLLLGRDIVDTQPFIWRQYRVSPRYTYVLDLAQTEEALWAGMDKERRWSIGKARRDGVLVEATEDWRIVAELVCDTLARQGVKSDRGRVGALVSTSLERGLGFARVALQAGVPVACAFIAYDARRAYYLLGGRGDESTHPGAGRAVLWDAILHAKSLGIAAFDFEGSMVPSIEQYFRGFGGRLVPYFRILKAPLPVEMALKLVRRGLV